MPGVNCAIFKCSALQNLKIFKLKYQQKTTSIAQTWRKSIDVITKDRFIDKGLQS